MFGLEFTDELDQSIEIVSADREEIASPLTNLVYQDIDESGRTALIVHP
jgi:hypothetical protein